MSMTMEEEFKRWTAKRKAALVTEVIQGKACSSLHHCSFRRGQLPERLVLPVRESNPAAAECLEGTSG